MVVVFSVVLYASSVHAAAGNSDGATVILEGKSFASGNFTLDHWGLSLDSFWLVDVPLYALAVVLGGLRADLLHLVPAIVAACVVVLGAFMAARGRTRSGAVLAAATVVVMLGFPTHAFAEFFLMGPLHVTTTLWCLLAVVSLRRGRFGWGVGIAAVLLAAGMGSDLQALVLGVAPIGMAGIAASLRERRLKAGAPAVVAAGAAVVLWKLGRAVARAVGAFAIAPANPIAPVHQMLQNLHHVVTYGAALEGVGYHPFGSETVPPLLEAAHGVGLALGVVAVLGAAVSLVWSALSGSSRRGAHDRGGGVTPEVFEQHFFDDVLVLGYFASCAVFVGLSFSASGAFGRYLTPAVIFGSILAGRLVGRLTDRLGRSHLPVGALSLLGAVGLAAAVGYGATFASTLAQPAPVQPASQLAAYLSSHGLDRGVGDYWSSSIVTVESAGKVVVRPVLAAGPGQRLVRYERQTPPRWYRGTFQFLVFNAAEPWGAVDLQTAEGTYGRPAHVAVVGSYHVLTWNHPIIVPAR